MARSGVLSWYRQSESKMTKLIGFMVALGCMACTTSGGSPSPDSGTGSDGAVVDAAPDAFVSYAPCDGCCDPIHQTGCDVGQACYELPRDPAAHTACMTPGIAGLYENCDEFATTANSCMAGMTCVGLCSRLCASDADCKKAGRNGEDTTCGYFLSAPGRTAFGTCS